MRERGCKNNSYSTSRCRMEMGWKAALEPLPGEGRVWRQISDADGNVMSMLLLVIIIVGADTRSAERLEEARRSGVPVRISRPTAPLRQTCCLISRSNIPQRSGKSSRKRRIGGLLRTAAPLSETCFSIMRYTVHIIP